MGRRFPFRGALIALALIALLGWPALATVIEAIRDGDTGPVGGWFRPLQLALESTRLVLATEVLALPAGTLLALFLFRTDLWGRRLLLGLMITGALMPMPLHAIGWLGALGNVMEALLTLLLSEKLGLNAAETIAPRSPQAEAMRATVLASMKPAEH